MREIQASDAKARLAQLLDEVERGETVVITRHGKPIARLVPENEQQLKERQELIERIKEFRRTGPSMTIKEILTSVHDGHKY